MFYIFYSWISYCLLLILRYPTIPDTRCPLNCWLHIPGQIGMTYILLIPIVSRYKNKTHDRLNSL